LRAWAPEVKGVWGMRNVLVKKRALKEKAETRGRT